MGRTPKRSAEYDAEPGEPRRLATCQRASITQSALVLTRRAVVTTVGWPPDGAASDRISALPLTPRVGVRRAPAGARVLDAGRRQRLRSAFR